MNLRQKAASGVKWIGISSVITTALQFFQLGILARLLTPEDFGLIAMSMLILGFTMIYSDMGISNAIIHYQDTTDEQLSSLYWLNLLAGFVVFGIVIILTPLIVSFYNEPRLSDIILWISLIFLIIPIGQQFQILLEKGLHFKSLAIIEVSAVFSGTIVAVASALYGQGVFSIVWGELTNNIIKSLLLFSFGIREWCPQIRFKRSGLKRFLSFGLYQMGERSINYFSKRFDQLIIGTIMGAQALGYYNFAYTLVIFPIIRINPIVTRVAFPVFSLIQTDTDRLKQGYHFTLKLLSAINFPLLFGLGFIAPLFIPLIFGEQWINSVLLVQILAVVALFLSVGNPVGALLLARGKANWGFWWNIVVISVQLPSIYLGIHLAGEIGVCISLLIVQVLFSIIGYVILIRNLLGRCLYEYLNSMYPALVSSFLMILILGLISIILKGTPAFVLSVKICSGILIYFIVQIYIFKKSFHEFKHAFWKT